MAQIDIPTSQLWIAKAGKFQVLMIGGPKKRFEVWRFHSGEKVREFAGEAPTQRKAINLAIKLNKAVA